eukprot:4478092-Amphidinium_carterae.1
MADLVVVVRAAPVLEVRCLLVSVSVEGNSSRRHERLGSSFLPAAVLPEAQSKLLQSMAQPMAQDED